MKIDGFLLAIIAAIALALAAPQLGSADGPLHLSRLTNIGVSLVFFLHGAGLSPQALKTGASNWRLHLLVQASTFLLFPALGFAIFAGARSWLPDETRLGIFYLCALSSTISSSVAMTALARGDVGAAVFNATLSGLLGMVITPFLVGLVATTASAHIPLLPAIVDVAQKLLLPFIGGQLARPLLVKILAPRKAWVTRIDRSVIVLIVYGAFCDSTSAGIWNRYAPLLIGEIGLIVAGLLVLALVFDTFGARALRLTREDEAVAVFCGSTKSLANGAPIASVLFAANPALGMILLPLVLYHLFQLIACSALARRYAARADRDAPARAAA